MSDTRLNKAIANAGFCSRRKADELIFAGMVTVNNVQEQNPARRVNGSDKIRVQGKLLGRANVTSRYFMLHKPVQTVCTTHDPEGRPTILDCLPPHLRQTRLYPVGRLDYFSEGLLLLTNDGEFANRITHPRYHLDKTYHVLVREDVPPDALEVMRKGMKLKDGPALLPIQVTTKQTKRGTLLEMTLHQGINRQIRRMCQQLGLTILRLKRVAQGELALGNLEPGQIRPLTAEETSSLLKATEIQTK